MSTYAHLPHVMQVMTAEPNYREWAPLIDKLPAEAQPECREWLRQEAKKRQLHERASPRSA